MDEAVLALARDLIQRPSVTPDDGGCQALLGTRLEKLGFAVEALRFGAVDNLWAVRGDVGPLCVFAGHTDVVPTGPVAEWSVDPFAATLQGGMLYGRGAADMKSALAAMVCACEMVLEASPSLPLRIAFLITSDEEGPAVDGTVRVVETLRQRGLTPDYCIVGEPSSATRLGDMVRIGRRGSLGGRLRVLGKQGHVAYPELAANPLHMLAPALAALAAESWDAGNDAFPPTSFQASNLQSGTGATNVIPGTAELLFNFRFSTEQTPEALQERVARLLAHHELRYELEWTLSGQPFLTPADSALVRAVRDGVREVTGGEPALSTSGGTSDGRFIAPLGTQVIELGHLNATIHQIDEHVPLADLAPLARCYAAILRRLAAS